jgi:hypothetical protein
MIPNTQLGLCGCGCGQSSGVHPRTNGKNKRGTPRRFIPGHQTRGHMQRARWGDKSIDVRFWEKVNKNGPYPKNRKLGRCWLWTGGTDSKGYGRLGVNGGTEWQRSIGAHQYAFVTTNSILMSSQPHVLHRCDTPACVRPSHLRAGTHKENMGDMVKRGRHYTDTTAAVAARRKYDKLPVKQVERRYQAGETTVDIATSLGIAASTIQRFLKRRGFQVRRPGARVGHAQTAATRAKRSESLKRAYAEGRH